MDGRISRLVTSVGKGEVICCGVVKELLPCAAAL